MTDYQFKYIQDNLVTNDTSGGGLRLKVDLDGSSVTVSENIAQVNGQTVNVGTGAASTGTLRVTTSTDSTIGTVTQITNALPSGENHLGAIGGNTFTLSVTQTTNASAYEAGDSVGGKITITNAMRVSGGTGVLQSIHLIDTSNQKAALDILIFDSDPSSATITDDTAFVYSTDISKQIARIPVTAADYTTINSIATVSLGGLSRIVQASGSRNLYAAIVLSGAPTYASTSAVRVVFGILQD